MRAADLLSAAYMAASAGSSFAASAPAGAVDAARGVIRATTEAEASRGEIELAISRGVVPAGTSRTEPSGRWIAIVELMANRFPSGLSASGLRGRTLKDIAPGTAGRGATPRDYCAAARSRIWRVHFSDKLLSPPHPM